MPLSPEEHEEVQLGRRAVNTSTLTDSEKVKLHRWINDGVEADITGEDQAPTYDPDEILRLFRRAIDTSALTDSQKVYLHSELDAGIDDGVADSGDDSDHPSGSDVLQEFEVDSVMFYDGSGHRLGRSICTLTRTRLIIDDARGGISQIQLRNITGVRSMSRKMLRVQAPGVAYDIYCVSKDQKNLLDAWLSEAIRGA